MARYSSLKLLFLKKYRTTKKIYKQLRPTSATKPLFPVVSIEEPPRNGGINDQSQNGSTSGSVSGRNRRRGHPSNSQVDTVDCCLLICDCIRHYKLATFVFIVVAGLVTTTGLYIHHQDIIRYQVYRGDVFTPKHGIRLKRCTFPVMKPFSKEVKPFISYSSSPNCAQEQITELYQRPYKLNGRFLEKNMSPHGKVDGCCYRPFYRSDDKEVGTANYCQPMDENITLIPEDVEYLEVLCISQEQDFRDGFSFIPKKDKVEERISNYESLRAVPPRLSVLILGMDATSRMNFIRAMPKSNEYLLKNLSAISLNGYTKVAENTLPNIIPFLAGRTLEEFKELCVDESYGAYYVHLDACPFMWKHFAQNGYRTGFAEDDVDIGIFNMNWGNAFVQPPTDYYLRPFTLRMQRAQAFRDGYCYGSSLSFEKLLENIKSMAETFSKKSYFQFTWSTKLSHDDLNKLRWGDDLLLELLDYLHKHNYLNNTALLVVGDHGSRLDRIRSTRQGKLEDRMPLAYVVLPEWFKTEYKGAYQNLKRNAEKIITSAFDMHKTLYDFMDLNRLQGDNPDEDFLLLPDNDTVSLSEFRGSSLFRELKENRTCFEAGIPLHWCICHKKITQAKDTDVAQSAAAFIVGSLNILLEGQPCATLELKSIDEVSKWDPKEIIRDDCDEEQKTSRGSQLNGNSTTAGTPVLSEPSQESSCNVTSEDVLVLQIAFTVRPSDATFETTVLQLDNGGWKLTEDVVRTNAYEGQSKCVEQKLKPYCYCDDY